MTYYFDPILTNYLRIHILNMSYICSHTAKTVYKQCPLYVLGNIHLKQISRKAYKRYT